MVAKQAADRVKKEVGGGYWHPADQTTWSTVDEARRHGWLRPRDAHRHLRPGLRIADVSGGNYHGYEYAVVSCGDGADCALLHSRTLWFTEGRNQLGRRGSFAAMFHVRDLRRCRPSRRAAIGAQEERVEGLERELTEARARLEELKRHA